MREDFKSKLIELEIKRRLRVDLQDARIEYKVFSPLKRESKKKFFEFMRTDPYVKRNPDEITITVDGLVEATWAKYDRACWVLFVTDRSPPLFQWQNLPLDDAIDNLSSVMLR